MKICNPRLFLACSWALAATVSGAHAMEYDALHDHGADRVTLSAGLEYSSGDYGSTLGDTEDWYAPLSLGYAHGPWRVKLIVPWLSTTSPDSTRNAGIDTRLDIGEPTATCTAGAACPGTGTVSPHTTQAGIGDISLALYYSLPALPAGLPEIELGAKFKAPTADAGRGLGTGAWDYSLTIDLYEPLGDAALLGGLRHTFKGDIAPDTTSPGGIVLDDVFAGYLGAEYRFTGRWLGGVALDYREASTVFSDEALELSGYAVWKPLPAVSVTASFGGGFTDASPEVFAGLTVGWRFDAPWH